MARMFNWSSSVSIRSFERRWKTKVRTHRDRVFLNGEIRFSRSTRSPISCSWHLWDLQVRDRLQSYWLHSSLFSNPGNCVFQWVRSSLNGVSRSLSIRYVTLNTNDSLRQRIRTISRRSRWWPVLFFWVLSCSIIVMMCPRRKPSREIIDEQKQLLFYRSVISVSFYNDSFVVLVSCP